MTGDDLDEKIAAAADRFARTFYVIKDHYSGASYPYWAPATLIDSKPDISSLVQSGTTTVECVASTPLIRICRMKRT